MQINAINIINQSILSAHPCLIYYIIPLYYADILINIAEASIIPVHSSIISAEASIIPAHSSIIPAQAPINIAHSSIIFALASINFAHLSIIPAQASINFAQASIISAQALINLRQNFFCVFLILLIVFITWYFVRYRAIIVIREKRN